ncbi:putative E3 ubiquitin-protein ligase UBR7 isoform X2 [Petaurus breviceps papuanus]|uniref:putative E3 ubiquitin-protein ligase UBR7 isoform X2 n=1 Tax=Petaurus breviceps papuanus TaxID=3040969 RepID=UPI0036DEEBDE
MAGAERGGGRPAEQEPVVSLVDVLEEDEELENEACAVLGGSDSEKCSYSQGSVKRQALYACSTCTPEGEEPAGICLACSYECHGSHKLFELYTKRNFRCDCGNSKFKNLECKLLPIPDEMIQCVVCEDWFHGRHLGAVPPESGDFQEMVCQACMKHCSFLWAYAAQLAVPTVTKIITAEDDGVLNVDVTEDQKVIKAENGAKHHESIPEKSVLEKGEDVREENKAEQVDEPSTSSGSECDLQTVSMNEHHTIETHSGCKLQDLKTKKYVKQDTATYWPHNWRNKLCTCSDCMKMYADLEVLFLTDEYDTVLAYENKGKSDQGTDRRDPLMDTLNSMNRVQQVELICEYNDLKTELKDYLKRFADEGTVVKREDIQQFFEEFQSRKRRRLDGIQYYCS